MQALNSTDEKLPKRVIPIDSSAKPALEALKPIWSEVHFFLEDSEAKLLAFKKSIDQKSSDLEATAELTAAEFQEFLHEGEVWFSNLVKRAEQLGSQAEAGIDTLKVRAHLAKMDSKDGARDILDHLNRFTNEVDALISRSEHELADKLKTFSAKCRELKNLMKPV